MQLIGGSSKKVPIDILSVTKIDDVFVKVDCEASTAQELCDYFTFEVPGFRFMPSYRNKVWDGKIRLYSVWDKKIYTGLLPQVTKWAYENDYSVDGLSNFRPESIEPEELKEFVDSLDLQSKNQKLTIRPYQYEAVYHSLKSRRCVLVSPTASGKSLMIYSIIRYLNNLRSLIVVPTISLVEQMYKDFTDYSTANGWVVEKNCHRIYAGSEKDTEKRITISTWQSLFRLNKKYFSDFGLVVGDEAHLHKANSLKGILEKLVNCQYRIGTTGTLDGTKTHKLVLEGLFGPVHQVTTTKELMDTDYLAELKIQPVIIKYPEGDCKIVKELDYVKELQFLVGNKQRNSFIVDLTHKLQGNTLVLYQLVEKHGKSLYNLMEQKEGKNVFFIHGGISAEDRESVRELCERTDNNIIVASYGTFSTGINIKNLNNVVFASPSKSRIRNLQSIGRGLRRTDRKTKVVLIDVVDDLTIGKYMNYTFRHYLERVKIYHSEKFNILKSYVHSI